MKNYLAIALVAIITVSCGTHKVVNSSDSSISSNSAATIAKKLDFVRKVNDNAVYTQNISSKISFSIDAMGRDVSVDGKLQMRKNEVIRITLTPLGIMEVARIELTPDYVLLMDRFNKEYVKAKYSDVGFLNANGLDFYTLQSLFWNELFIPGKQKMTDNMMKEFDVEFTNATQNDLILTTKDLLFKWVVNPSNATISSANVEYGKGTSYASVASWQYDRFTAVGSKQFPTEQTISLSSKAVRNGATMSLGISLKKISTDSDWETLTSISDHYTEVTVEDLLRRLTSL